MVNGPKRREPPAEPFKRVLGLAVRAIAGSDQLQVAYSATKPELDGNTVQLPEPSRVPSAREVAVIRGWADSLALTAAVHDKKIHRRLVPEGGQARAVFEAVERARIEALGANRMPGMAENLTAKLEDHYAHGRFADVKDRAEAPLEDAIALMVRERLCGLPPPKSAQSLVDVWRPWIEERAGKTLERMEALCEDQEAFGRLLRDVLRQLELTEDLAEGEPEQEDSESDENADGGDQQSEATEGAEGQEQSSEEQLAEGEEGESEDITDLADADQLDADVEGEESAETHEPWRPNTSVLDDPEKFGYRVFTRAFDEEVA